MKQIFRSVIILAFILLSGCNEVNATEMTQPTSTNNVSRIGSEAAGDTSEISEATNNGGTMSVNPTVLIETTKGNITIELDAENAPISTENFLSYVKDGFYDGTVFHRVIKGFMIQGGGMDADMKEKQTNAPIKNEANNGLKNMRGTLAMARTPMPHSASSQFFINVADNDFLNFRSETTQGWGYAVFGKVTEGMDIVDAIVESKTGNKKGHQDVPVEAIVINKATLVE